MLFHGRATDENDLFGLLDIFDAERRLVGATVRGPLSLPPGGAHWYAVREIGFPDPETFHSTYGGLSQWLDAFAQETAVPAGRTVFGGFSQGAVMSYALGLGGDRPPPAGILALSGFIPTVDGWSPDFSTRQGLPVFIGHGSMDPVIEVEWGRRARQQLEASGVACTYRESESAHGVDPRTVPEAIRWLEAVESRFPSPT